MDSNGWQNFYKKKKVKEEEERSRKREREKEWIYIEGLDARYKCRIHTYTYILSKSNKDKYGIAKTKIR